MPHVLNVTVPIPETHVLITKDEYEELIAYSLDPVWNMSDLKKKLKLHLMRLSRTDYYFILDLKRTKSARNCALPR